jgi:hypothetical protein
LTIPLFGHRFLDLAPEVSERILGDDTLPPQRLVLRGESQPGLERIQELSLDDIRVEFWIEDDVKIDT